MTRRQLAIAFPSLLLGFILVGVGLINSTPTYAQDGGEHGQSEDEDAATLRGAALYAEFCGACHGAEGDAIADAAAFVSISNYEVDFARGRIEQGYDSTADDGIVMIGYGEDYNGPLSDQQVDDILAYMASWSDEEISTPHLPEPNLEPGDSTVGGRGDAAHGAEIYATTCLGCHGRNTQGRNLPNFPAFTIDENTRRIVERGTGHNGVPAFSVALGGYLTTEDLDDLDAFLQSLEIEEEEEGPQGVSILVIMLGLAAVGGVGGYYLAAQRSKHDTK